MTPDRWQKIDALLQQAVKRPPDKRAEFLDQFCDDEDSRREIESLLSFQERIGDFLEVPVLEAAANLFGDQDQTLVGLEIGPYKIEKLLGAGGMGEVYLAEDMKLDRRVAIKFLPADLEADELARRRLIREAKAAAKLDHPNICAIHEVAEEAGRNFIVMQYVEGETLARRIQREPLGLCEALDVTVQVSDALAEAHSHGIVHRDMKPQNVMITSRGQVKVLDFGLAKMVNGVAHDELRNSSLLSVPGLILGTAAYMSPEQARGSSVDERSDLFSIGVMLYESITGQLPFDGETPMEIISRVIHVEPLPPSRLNPHITPELEALTLKALAKDPAARYQSATELLEDLLSVRAGLQAKDHAPGPEKVITPRSTASLSKTVAALPDALRAPRVYIPVAVVAIALVGTFALPSLLRAPYRPKPEALSWYNQGTADLRNGSPYAAFKKFQAALKEDDGFALAHARLAEAMTQLDLSEEANVEVNDARRLVPDLSSLPQLDSLYLQAISDAVSHHYADAITHYKEIARLAPDSDKAHAYLNLGRVYEKNEQKKEAIESYLRASELAGNEPAVLLRLAVLYDKKPDLRKAGEAFQKAASIYEAQSNVEGLTEVRYQRGVLLNSQGALSDAETELESARAAAQNNKNPHQLIRSLLQLSSVYRSRSNTERAEQYAKEAKNLAETYGMQTLATQSWIDLGRIYLHRGSAQDYIQAENCLRTALSNAQRQKAPFNEAAARFFLADLYCQRHQPDEAVTLIQQAIEFYEGGGYSELSRARILKARAHSLRGDYDAALNLYDIVLQDVQATDDRVLFARTQADMANVFIQMEQYEKALTPLHSSIEIHKSMELYSPAGYGLADLGDALWRMGRYDAAREALDRAAEMADMPVPNANAPVRAKISLITANLLLSEHRFNDAAASARKALEQYAHEEPESNAQYALGLAQAYSGNREGIRTCRLAVETATSYNDAQLLPNAQLALAEVLLEGGDAREALNLAREAQQKFAAVGRRESEWRAWVVAGRASQKAGDPTTAHKYLLNAEGQRASLETSWGADVYNFYVTRPDVKYSVQHLRQALGLTQ